LRKTENKNAVEHPPSFYLLQIRDLPLVLGEEGSQLGNVPLLVSTLLEVGWWPDLEPEKIAKIGNKYKKEKQEQKTFL
jgi:hypothetical protein